MKNRRFYALFLKFSNTYQLISGIACVRYNRSRYDLRKIYFCYDDYWKNQNIDSFYLDVLRCFNVELCDVETYAARMEELKGCYCIEIKINQGFQLPGAKKKVMVIDDGLGAYRTNTRILYKDINKEYDLLGVSKKNGYVVFILKRALKKVLGYGFNAERFSLFNKSDLTLNEYVSREITDVLSLIADERIKRDGHGLGCYNTHQRKVVFFTQPGVALGWLTAQEYSNLLRELVQWSRSLYEADFFIKKHPADKFDYEGFSLVEFDGMAEEYMCRERESIAAVLSISSTSLVTAKWLFGIKAFSVSIPQAVGNGDEGVKRLLSMSSEELILPHLK